MADVTLTFGEWLKDRLTERGYTQTAFAHQLGVAPSTVSSWTNDVQPPRPLNCLSIAETLRLDAGEVLRRAGYDPEMAPLAPHPSWTRRRPRTGLQAAVQVVFVPVIGMAPADEAEWDDAGGAVLPMAAVEVEGVGDAAFILVSGKSMAARGIQAGDHVMIDRDAVPQSGDVVLIRIRHEYVLREWWPEGDQDVILRAGAPGIPPIRIKLDQDDAFILGVARKRIRVTEV